MPMYRPPAQARLHQSVQGDQLAVNLRDLARVTGDEVSPETLLAAGIVRRRRARRSSCSVTGEIGRARRREGRARVSASARAKIEAAGGRVEDVE